MGLTYNELLAIMESNQDPAFGDLMGSGEETRSMKIIRAGMHLREGEDELEFWNDFMQLCGDAEGMSELLGVKSAEVRRWTARIRENINRVKEINSTNPEGEDNSKLMATGDNDGAISVDDNGFAKR